LDTAGRIIPARVPLTLFHVALAAALAALGVWLATGRLAWRRTPMDLPLAVLALALVASVPLGLPFGLDLLALSKPTGSILLFVLLVQAVRSRREVDLVLAALVGIMTASSLFALVARFTGVSASIIAGGVARTSGTFDDPNIFGTALVTALAVAAALWLEDPRWRRAWLLAAVPVMLAALAFTFSRGAFLGLVVAAAVLLAGSRVSVATKTGIVVVAVLVAVLAGSALLSDKFVQDKILGIADDPSTMSRVYMWQSSFDMARAYPLGIGLGEFDRVYPVFRLPGAHPGLVRSHNAYLTLLVELGLLGLAVYAWFAWRWGSLMRPLLSGRPGPVRALALGAVASAVAIAAQSFTYSLEFSKPLWVTFALGAFAWRMGRTEDGRVGHGDD
jgi:O-antigen ligase